jgi:hypothetical protein
MTIIGPEVAIDQDSGAVKVAPPDVVTSRSAAILSPAAREGACGEAAVDQQIKEKTRIANLIWRIP